MSDRCVLKGNETHSPTQTRTSNCSLRCRRKRAHGRIWRPLRPARTIRARIKHLNSFGIPGIKAGKGGRVPYTFEIISELMIALAVEETGADPTDSAQILKATWDHGISKWARLALSEESAESPVFLKITPQFMSRAWISQTSPRTTINGFQEGKSQDRIFEREIIGATRARKWISFRNLTEDFRVLSAALEQVES